MLKLFKNFLVVTAAFLVLSGCSLIPTEHQQSQSVKSTEQLASSHDLVIRRAIETGPEMVRVALGTNENIASYPLRENLEIISKSDQSAGSKDAASGSSAVSIPLGVKIGLLGVGIGVLALVVIVVWKYVKRTAFGAGISLGNDLLKQQIDGWREHAMTTTDPKELADANSEIASLEAARGKLSSQRPD